MRLLSTLPVIGRTPTVRSTLLPLVLARSASRLSSIHHGLRRSERARPQGATQTPMLEIRQPETERPYLSPTERRKARATARQNPLGYKIKKGKKDITERPGPGRRRTSKRWADPRDPLGAGSLLKKFKTGQLLEELRKAEKSTSEHIQSDDFARQLVADEVEDLMSSVKRPVRLRRSKTKSHYEQLRPGEAASQHARDNQDWDSPGAYSSLSWGRQKSDTARTDDRASRGQEAGEIMHNEVEFDISQYQGSNRKADYDRETSGEAHIWDRSGRSRRPQKEPDMEAVTLKGSNLAKEAGIFDLSDRRVSERESNHGDRRTFHETVRSDKATPREFERWNMSEPRGSDREVNNRGGGHDRPGRDPRDSAMSRHPASDQRMDSSDHAERRSSQRANAHSDMESKLVEAQNGGSKEEGGVQKEKPKKKYVAPVSIPYTTAASQFIYGTSTVEAALTTSRRKLYKLYIAHGANRNRQEKDEHLAKLAFKKDVPVEWVEEERVSMLNRMSSSRPHNGYVLEASPLPQLPITSLGEVSDELSWPGFKVECDYQSAEEMAINGTSEFIMTEPSAHKPFVLLLDEILDPGNLGAIIRTASFMGISAVVTSRGGSAPVTPVVLKASAGAAETMTMLSVSSPADFVQESRANGWRVFAAMPPKSEAGRTQLDMQHIERTDPLFTSPCLLVMGSEGAGLSRQLRRCAHSEVTIPNMSGSKVVDSLNVGVAAALLCSAFVRGRSSSMQKSGVVDDKAMF